MNGTGPVEGEEEVRWKELRRQAWEGLGWKSRSGWEGRADYAGNSKCCSRGKKLVGVGSEAWAVVGWKSTDETV